MINRFLRYSCIALCFAIFAQYFSFGFAFIRYSFLLCSFFCVLYWMSTCTFDYWRDRGIVTPVTTPLYGNIKDIAKFTVDIGTGFQQLYNLFPNERYFGVYQTLSPTFVVRDPELFRRICIKDFQHFTDRGFFFNKNVDPLGENILFATGNEWKRLRMKMSPTFSPQKLKGMLYLVTECGDALVSYLLSMTSQDGGSAILSVMDAVGRYTTDAIVKCAFSVDCDSINNPDNEFKKASIKFYEMTPWNIFEKFMRAFWPSFVLFFRIRMVPRYVNEFFFSIVSEVLKQRQDIPPDQRRGDLIDALLQIREETEKKKLDILNQNLVVKETDEELDITDNLIAANAFLMFLGGYETTQSTITFALCALAGDQRVQDLLREELRDVFFKHGTITKEALDSMKYMDMVLQETLRLYPIFQNIQRLCTKDYKIPDSEVTIERGMIVIFPVYGVQRDPKFFTDPEKFYPERFSDEAKSEIFPGTYLPFGDGPRYCIGMRFAMVQMKVCLAKLLLNFKFTTCAKSVLPTPLEPRSMTACPKTSFVQLTLIRQC